MNDAFPGASVGMNHSDEWLTATAARLGDIDSIGLFAPRRVYLDRNCEIFCLVSPEDYEWVTQWRWKWNFDRTRSKRYAIRTPRIARDDGTYRSLTIYMHKALLDRWGDPQPTELHIIGDHQNGESLDNQRGNIKWATRSENRKNRKR